jgi:hypothetical protein
LPPLCRTEASASVVITLFDKKDLLLKSSLKQDSNEEKCNMLQKSIPEIEFRIEKCNI